MKKKRVAKEWLYYLAFTIPALVLLIIFWKGGDVTLSDLVGVIIVLSIPYLLFCLIRSIVWAVKTIRAKD